MKEQIQMLLELGFPLRFNYKIHPSNGYADDPSDVPEPTKEYIEPTYWEVKQWLYDKHKIYFKVSSHEGVIYFKCSIHANSTILYRSAIINPITNSPITAEVEGIKKAVECLHKQNK